MALPRPRSHGVLTPLQTSLLDVTFSTDVAREGYALAGATALAEFYFGHRLSRDLDLFAESAEDVAVLGDAFEPVVRQGVSDSRIDLIRRAPAFRRFVVHREPDEQVQVDLGCIDPPLLDPIASVARVNVLGLTDLAVGKVLAIHDRTEVRDAIDLWMLDEGGVDLERIRQLALWKDPGLAAAPLTVIDSLDRLRASIRKLPWPEMLITLTAGELEEFLEHLSVRFLDGIRATLNT